MKFGGEFQAIGEYITVVQLNWKHNAYVIQ
jgi:hypothetical protein